MIRNWIVIGAVLLSASVGWGGNDNGASAASVHVGFTENPIGLTACAGEAFRYDLSRFYDGWKFDFFGIKEGGPKWASLAPAGILSGTAPAPGTVTHFVFVVETSEQGTGAPVDDAKVILSVVPCGDHR